MNLTENTRRQSRQLQAPWPDSSGHRFVSPQYGQYWAGARFSLMSRSSQGRFVGPGDPLGEPLALLALGVERLHDALDEVGQLVAGDLVAAYLPAEPGIQAQAATQVHLEALDLLAGVVGDD